MDLFYLEGEFDVRPHQNRVQEVSEASCEL
jgi:hypothetical protein